MWISKLVLNLRSRAARRDLANPYEMHRTLSRAVSEALQEGRERLLWRLEPTRAYESPVVLVQTLTEPDWGVLEEGYAEEVFPPKPFYPAFQKGQVLHFRLRANPSKRLSLLSVKSPHRRGDGPRIALKTREEKLAWLERKLREGGFHLMRGEQGYLARILQDTFLEVSKPDHRIQVQAVLFEGVLQVQDPERALKTLEQGIGPGKALGLGLLSLHP